MHHFFFLKIINWMWFIRIVELLIKCENHKLIMYLRFECEKWWLESKIEFEKQDFSFVFLIRIKEIFDSNHGGVDMNHGFFFSILLRPLASTSVIWFNFSILGVRFVWWSSFVINIFWSFEYSRVSSVWLWLRLTIQLWKRRSLFSPRLLQ